ncbi:hypothetical protein AAP_01526 [Ascosphaera apis ARSEF 7405]|uniref:Uncharacterized protein n=1 Tax=Ascosphaera apis ARSEF 7405 TaxID=392613 RepID=A0A168BAN9_9EURO|nr:hypothetical protein AAP_01526 [Ascosphaera apis ARSEF 7405]
MSMSNGGPHSASHNRDNRVRRPLRYYTVSYSHSQGRHVVRPDGIISDSEEIRDQISRTTQAFLARRAAASVVAQVNNNAPPVGSRHYHCRSRTDTTIGGELPPRSRPVAVSLPGDISMRRYISNHLAVRSASSSSSSGNSRGGVGNACQRNGSGAGLGSGSGRRQSPLSSSPSDENNMMFMMDEDAEIDSNERVDAMRMTQRFTNLTTNERGASMPHSLVRPSYS